MSEEGVAPIGDGDPLDQALSADVHIPILLRRFVSERSRQPGMAGAEGPSIASASGPDADHVAAVLAVKYMKLETAITALRSALPSITDTGLRIDMTTQIGEAEAERALCKARHDQIDAGGTFREPPQSEEDKLLAAISAVDSSLAATSAVAALIGAVHQLVAAFPGSTT